MYIDCHSHKSYWWEVTIGKDGELLWNRWPFIFYNDGQILWILKCKCDTGKKTTAVNDEKLQQEMMKKYICKWWKITAVNDEKLQL